MLQDTKISSVQRENWSQEDYYLAERPDYEPLFPFSVDGLWDIVQTNFRPYKDGYKLKTFESHGGRRVSEVFSSLDNYFNEIGKNVSSASSWDQEVFCRSNGHNIPIQKELFVDLYMRFLGNGNMDTKLYDSFPNSGVRNTFLFFGIIYQRSRYNFDSYPDPKNELQLRNLYREKYGEIVELQPRDVVNEVRSTTLVILDKCRNKGKRSPVISSKSFKSLDYFSTLFKKYGHNDFLGNNIGDKYEDRVGYLYYEIKNRGRLGKRD